jgi:hypothetical protein
VALHISQGQKRFFVDSHESKANRKYRKEQCARYLRRERLMHRWYQFTAEEVNSLVNKELLLPDRGYRYETEEGEKMHIDEIDNEEILTKIYQEYCYCGNLSIRMNPLEERPLLSFGHDECIFRQFIFTGCS